MNLDSSKFAFIICSNNSLYLEECLYYIRKLSVPEGMSIEILSTSDAQSMAAGYNECMHSSDAKYKIYLHHDTFIINTNLLNDLLSIFSNPSIGMVGPVGCKEIIPNGDFVHSNELSFSQTLLFNSSTMLFINHGFGVESQICDVAMLDGMLLATQYDLEWDSINFDGWDFYDSSQSANFIRAGNRCVATNINGPWAIHDEGVMNLANYDKYRERFCHEYNDLGYTYSELDYNRSQYYQELKSTLDDFFAIINQLSPSEVLIRLSDYVKSNTIDARIGTLNNILSLTAVEINESGKSIFYPFSTFSDSSSLYTQLRFLVWRIAYLNDQDAIQVLDSFVSQGSLSLKGLSELKSQVLLSNP